MHTPGPWRFGTGAATGKDYAICKDHMIIATVVGMGYPCGKGHHPISDANARLIAAAPDLLRELQSFVDRWGKYPKKPTGDDLQIYLDDARAVIAKATT